MNAPKLLDQALSHAARGERQSALSLFRQLQAQQPARPDVLNDCGAGLGLLGCSDEALACFERVLEIDPGFVDALNNRGLVLAQLQRYEESVAALQRVLALEPTHLGALCTLGFDYVRLGRYEDALVPLARALEIEPRHVGALDNRGLAFAGLQRTEEALASFEKAILTQPDHAGALANAGGALALLGRYDEALVLLGRALALVPHHPDAHVNRGIALAGLSRYDEALATLDRALDLQPDYATALTNSAGVLAALGRYEEALKRLDRVQAMYPDRADTLANRGFTYYALDRREEALACLERAVALAPHDFRARYSLACTRLSLGDIEGGFRDFESRWQSSEMQRLHINSSQPAWRGEALPAGSSVLLWQEQGFGDGIQFVRYAPLVAARGLRVILCVSRPLLRLMRSVDGVDQLAADDEPLPRHDVQCPLMSLPLVMGTTLASIPAAVPYLRAETALATQWNAVLGPHLRRRIGLVWSGRREHIVNRYRDMPLQALLPLLDEETQFVSLQKDVSEADAALLERHPQVLRYGERLRDFADTAALISQLDLIITVDTAVAHLAAALGRPTWVLDRRAPCWRWLRGRDDSPWYPSLRLFRQKEAGNWYEVVERARLALRSAAPPTFSAAIPLDPVRQTSDEAQRWLERGAAAFGAQDYAQALECFEHALQLQPDHSDALGNSGLCLELLGQREQALSRYDEALRLDPRSVAVLNNRALLLIGLGRAAQAAADLERARALHPGRTDTLNNQGLALDALGRYDEALAAFEQALQLDPRDPDILANYSASLSHANRAEAALSSAEHALQLQPQHLDAQINRGVALSRLYREEQALECLDEALQRAPDHVRARTAMATTLLQIGQHGQALKLLEVVLQQAPEDFGARYHRGLARLSLGDLQAGFLDLETRWDVAPSLRGRWPELPVSLWLGREDLRGKRLLIQHEQGLGDAIQFIRYAPLLAERGARLLLRVPEALVRLFQSLPGEGIEVQSRDEPVADCDAWCPLMSLPLACGTTLETIPASLPYLQAEAGDVQQWAQQLGERRRPRIGLAWAGQRTAPVRELRDMPLLKMARLLDLDADFVSLQKEVSATDHEQLCALPTLLRYGEVVRDFADTAALVQNLDLVISVDTAVAHLAGALGKPVWLLNRHVPCWRWLTEREDSPWYPGLRIFGQSSPGDWDGVISAVGDALRQQLATKRS